jgi:hypothetical protein
MAGFSEADAYHAEKIVEQLMHRGERAIEIENDIVVYDLELDTAQFLIELEIFREFDVRVPAMRVGDNSVPVSLRAIFGDTWPMLASVRGNRRYLHRMSYELFYDMIQALWSEGQIDEFHPISREDARNIFKRRATDFLATRIAAVRGERWEMPASLSFRQKTGGPRVMTPGCYFTVTTNSPGLRVFWSGASWINPNYFQHPTSPATSVLQSGIYVFGVDGGAYGSKIQWDENATVSLPGDPQVHLNY